jgi:hypothetical protein
MMKSGDLFFFPPTGIMGRIIAAMTRSKYCHVGLYYEGLLLDFLTNTGYRITPIDQAIKEWGKLPDIYRCPYIDEFDVEDIVYEFKQLYNKPYGFLNAILTGLLQFTPTTWFQYEKDNSTPHCSQAICRSFRLGINLDLVPSKPDWRSTPEDIKQNKILERII